MGKQGEPGGASRQVKIPGLVDPETVRASRRCKVLIHGDSGTGKTTFAMKFPAPIYADTEQGGIHDDYLDLLKASGGAYARCGSMDDGINLTRSLCDADHPYRTFVLDTVTPLWSKECDDCARALATPRDPAGTARGRNVGRARVKLKRLFDLLMRIDMNIVVIAQSKHLWEDERVVGLTYDADAPLKYWFDLVVQAQIDRGKKRVAFIEKTRLRNFPMHTHVPLDIGEWAKRMGGLDVLAADMQRRELAAHADVEQLERLLREVKPPKGVSRERMVETWLERARVSSLYDLSADECAKAIEWCGKRIGGAPE